jgi:hypothetical protein
VAGILCGDLEIQNLNVTLKLQFQMGTIRQIIAILRKKWKLNPGKK